MFDCESNMIKKRNNDVVTTKKHSVWFFKSFFLKNKRLSSTKNRKEIAKLLKRFLDLFSKI